MIDDELKVALIKAYVNTAFRRDLILVMRDRAIEYRDNMDICRSLLIATGEDVKIEIDLKIDRPIEKLLEVIEEVIKNGIDSESIRQAQKTGKMSEVRQTGLGQ